MSRTRSQTVAILLHRAPNRHHQAKHEQSWKSWKTRNQSHSLLLADGDPRGTVWFVKLVDYGSSRSVPKSRYHVLEATPHLLVQDETGRHAGRAIEASSMASFSSIIKFEEAVTPVQRLLRAVEHYNPVAGSTCRTPWWTRFCARVHVARRLLTWRWPGKCNWKRAIWD